jgi:hypothetical protein
LNLAEGRTRDLVASQITKQTGKKLSGPTYERLKTIALTALQLVEYGMKLEKLYKGRQGRPEKGGQNVHLFEGKTRDLVASQNNLIQIGRQIMSDKAWKTKLVA